MRMMFAAVALVALSSTAALAADVANGKAVYDKSCKTCHGADGTPNPGIAKMMKVEMKDMKTVAKSMSDADIKTVVTAGKGKMRPVASVTGASVDDVVAYVKSMK